MWAGGDWLKLKAVFDLSRIRDYVWMLIELRRKHVVLLCECTMFQHTMMESESHSSSAWPAVACDAVFYLFVGFEDYHGQIQNSQNALPWYWSRNTEQDVEGCSQACCSELEFHKGMEKWFDLKRSQVFLLGQLVIFWYVIFPTQCCFFCYCQHITIVFPDSHCSVHALLLHNVLPIFCSLARKHHIHAQFDIIAELKTWNYKVMSYRGL